MLTSPFSWCVACRYAAEFQFPCGLLKGISHILCVFHFWCCLEQVSTIQPSCSWVQGCVQLVVWDMATPALLWVQFLPHHPTCVPSQNHCPSEIIHIFLSPFFFSIWVQQGFFSSIFILLDICAVPAVSLHMTTFTTFFFTFAKPVLACTWEAQVRLRATQALALAVLIPVVSWGEAIEDPPGTVITLWRHLKVSVVKYLML